MRRTPVLLTAALVATTLLAPTAGTAADGAVGRTCRGLPVTIYATSGTVRGTEGPDVVLVDGGRDVETYGGDDVICVIGRDRHEERLRGDLVVVNAGPGDDVVDGTGAPGRNISASLGEGTDRFEGGPGKDIVSGGAWIIEAGKYIAVDTEPDVLSGGGGQDQVNSGSPGQPNADVVDLGAGADRLVHAGTWAEGGSIVGGRGDDLFLRDLAAGATILDYAAGQLVEAGTLVAAWSDLDRFHLGTDDATPRELTLVGSAGDDSVSYVGENVLVTGRLGDGDDTLSVAGSLPARGSVVDAGPGRDLFDVRLYSNGSFVWDMRAGGYRATGTTTSEGELNGFEDAFALGDHVELAGTDRANDLYMGACSGALTGRRGGDRLKAARSGEFRWFSSCDRNTFSLLGGPGNDRLEGGPRKDRLVGGPGHDVADGGARRDRCSAEVLKRCETGPRPGRA